MNTEALNWTAVCAVDDILPNTGVCARLGRHHVAIFRVGHNELYAIDNIDPVSHASVMARGLVGSLGQRTVVASPLYKQHFDLRNGECLEDPALSVRAYAVRLEQDRVLLAAA